VSSACEITISPSKIIAHVVCRDSRGTEAENVHQKCKFVAATWPRVSFSWLYTLELYQGVMAKPKFHTMSPHMRQLMGEQKSLGSRFRRESRWSFYFGKGQGRAWASYEDDILQL